MVTSRAASEVTTDLELGTRSPEDKRSKEPPRSRQASPTDGTRMLLLSLSTPLEREFQPWRMPRCINSDHE